MVMRLIFHNASRIMNVASVDRYMIVENFNPAMVFLTRGHIQRYAEIGHAQPS